MLRRKRERDLCSEHSQFCVPVISYFRFLVDEHQFKLHEICRQRHELWIIFRASMPVPMKNPMCFDTYIDVVIETEYYNTTYGGIYLERHESSYPPLRSIQFVDMFKMYQTGC